MIKGGKGMIEKIEMVGLILVGMMIVFLIKDDLFTVMVPAIQAIVDVLR